MTEIQHHEISYRPLWATLHGRCQIDIWPLTISPLHEGLIVVTELPDNPGPSITNSIEIIAEKIEQDLLHWPLIAYRLVEHYWPRGHLPETFDLVDLTRSVDHPSWWVNPRWTHLDPDLIDMLAPPEMTPPTRYFAQLNRPLSDGEGPPANTGTSAGTSAGTLEGGPLGEHSRVRS